MTPESGAGETGDSSEWPFCHEADGTVWLERPDAQPVKILDRELRAGEALGSDAEGGVWLTGPDLRPIRLMRVGDDGPPTQVTLLLEEGDPRIALLKEGGWEIDAGPSELDPEPPRAEDWNDHPDPAAVYQPRADLRGIVTLDELATVPDPEWLVTDLMIEHELTAWYGRPKEGKTLTAIDLALSIATGLDFHGLRTGPAREVVYLIAEGNPKLFARRCQAWLDKRGIGRAPGTFRVLPARIAVSAPEAVRRLAREIGSPALLVIDCLNRVMVGDENSAQDMASFVAGCDELREATGCAVLVIHHAGKQKAAGLMGHTRLLAAVDSSVLIQKNSAGIVELKMEHQRNGPGDLAMAFRICEGPCLEAVLTRRDETDAQFLDFHDDPAAGQATRVRRLAATMGGRQKGEIIAAVMRLLRVSDKPAREALAEAVPTGADHAIEFEGKRIWLERMSARSTVMSAEPVKG